MYSAAYVLHLIGAIILIVLAVLPFMAFVKGRRNKPLPGAKLWRKFIMLCNFSLILAIITGVIMYPYFSMGRTWVALLLTVALGGTLGVMAKGLKLHIIKDGEEARKALMKVAYAGFAFVLLLLSILYMMSKWYYI
ncbi:MAG: hypothetical protein LRY73_01255 [Bacillus sp. (in: Bacteria)]|nr:hypothetical protein [Bacillus sp. (in: firmicutes)]